MGTGPTPELEKIVATFTWVAGETYSRLVNKYNVPREQAAVLAGLLLDKIDPIALQDGRVER